MKTQISILAFLLLSTWDLAQENSGTLIVGYPFAKIEDTDSKLSGWRINVLCEFSPSNGNFSHGLSVGYVGLSGDEIKKLTKFFWTNSEYETKA